MDAAGTDAVSIIVVTYLGDEVLSACLDSLAAACGRAPQIVVVDNSPSEDTRRIVSSHPNAVYVRAPGNTGFAGGNNLAIPHCDREFLLLLNNDTAVRSAESIAALVRFMRDNPRCGVAQGSLVLPNADGAAGGCGSFLTPFGFMYARGFGTPPDAPGLDRPVKCFSAMGAFMMVRRSAVERAGFLFRGNFGSYYEESDFCHRVWISGGEVWYVPTPPVEHLCGWTAGKFKRTDIMRRYIRNSFFSLLANLGLWSRLAIVPCYAAVMACHCLVHLLRGDTAAARADCGVVADTLRARKAIREARRAVKSTRRRSDWGIFRETMRLPPLRYMFGAVRSNA